MNALEKVLEEIDTEVQKQRELCKDLKGTPGYRLYEKVASVFKGIVTKHMDEVENEKIHHDEEYLARMGYMDKDGDWIFYDQDGCEFYCEKEFGSDKIDVYNVVTAWQPLPEPYKGGE